MMNMDYPLPDLSHWKNYKGYFLVFPNGRDGFPFEVNV